MEMKQPDPAATSSAILSPPRAASRSARSFQRSAPEMQHYVLHPRWRSKTMLPQRSPSPGERVVRLLAWRLRQRCTNTPPRIPPSGSALCRCAGSV